MGKGSKRGSTLLTVVVLLGALTVLTLVSLRVGQSATDEQLATVENSRAAYLAEAAIGEALEALRSGGDGSIGSSEAPAYLGGGVLWVEATNLGDDRTQLDAMAMKDGGRSALRVVVENVDSDADAVDGAAGGGDPFFTMLFSNKSMQLDQNVRIDSWDSTLGTYASQATNSKGGTSFAHDKGGAAGNATIQLDSGVKVFGDVHAGPGYNVSMAGSAYVSGSTTPNPATVPLTAITVPTIASSGAYSVANNATKTINPGTYHYTSITQGKFSKLRIIGPATVVLDGYNTGISATLEVDCTNGPVTVYDTGVWSVDKNYTVGPAAGTPIDASFLISSVGTVQFDQGSKISFGFYAPKSIIQVDQGAEVWGALVADEIQVDQGTKFHFDENLKGFELPWSVPDSVLGIESAGTPEITSWTRIEFPVAAYRGDRRDPFTLLGVQKAELPSPSELWKSALDQ